MNAANRRTGLLVCCAVLMVAGLAFGQDWPQWRGTNRDAKATGFTAPETWPKELTQKWKLDVGSGDATPALVGDRLYVFTRQGDEEVTLCLAAEDGKEIWRNKYAAQAVTGAAARHPGPRSSPAVADGKVVTLGVGGVLSCLNAADGTLVWRKDPFPRAVPKFFTGTSPILVDGLAIAHLGVGGNAAVVAFNLADGETKWQWTGEGPAYASPVLMTVADTKQLVVLGEKSLAGLAVADGKLLWQVAAAPQGRAYNAASPVIDGAVVIYTGQGKGTRAVKIEKTADGFSATQVWQNADLGTNFDTPVLKDGMLYGLSDGSSLFCMSAADGKVAWTDSARRGRGGFGSVVDAGSALFALASDSELVAFKPGTKGFEQLAAWKVADKATYAYPVIAGNRIFVKDEGSLTLWTLK